MSTQFTSHENDEPIAVMKSVTPRMAEEWLTKNKVNRPLKNRKIEQFKRDMKAGKWRQTGESLKFSWDDDLLDGQNRLWAVIESGCTVKFLVIYGVDPEAQVVMDSGSARTAADNLHMAGHKNAALVASIARRLVRPTDVNNVTNTEVHEFVEKYPDQLHIAADIAKRFAVRGNLITSTCGVAAWYIAAKHDWFTAEEFFAAAADKVGLLPGDPVLAMTAFFADKKVKRVKLPMLVQISVMIRCFNARHTGKSLKNVRYMNSDGSFIPVPPVAA